MFVMQGGINEGTGSPYLARLFLGVYEMRDMVMNHVVRTGHYEWRKQFDDLYAPVHDAISSARNHSARVLELVTTHRGKIDSGAIVSYQRNAVEIHESISQPLGESFATFLSSAGRATKLHQNVLKFLGLDLGMLYTSPTNFQAGIEGLRRGGEDLLADYLEATRAGWSEQLIKRRNDLEHGPWRLQDVLIRPGPGGVPQMVEPDVDGVPVSTWVADMLAHFLAFVEETTAYAVQRALAPGHAALIEIPPEMIDPAIKRRFLVSWPVVEPGARVWRLQYSPAGFPNY
jgi:hypothetical protein